MGYLREGSKNVFASLGLMFGGGVDAATSPAEGAKSADVFFVVNVSTVELPDVERYANDIAGARPVVLWNVELDTLRSDLGRLLTYLLILAYSMLAGV